MEQRQYTAWAVQRVIRKSKEKALMGIYAFPSIYRDFTSYQDKDLQDRSYTFKTRQRARDAIKADCHADHFCYHRAVKVIVTVVFEGAFI